MFCTDANYIFVHIQKTGGNSICTALGKPTVWNEKHWSALDLCDLHGPGTWEAAFTFGFVRNPWERLVSWWSMIDRRRGGLAGSNDFGRLVLATGETFEQFIVGFDELPDDEFFKSEWLLRSQSAMLADRQGRIMVDFVGRFEQLEEDWQRVAHRVGRPDVALPHVNRSAHGAYVDYYSPRTRDIVARHFAADIENFGYAYGRK